MHEYDSDWFTKLALQPHMYSSSHSTLRIAIVLTSGLLQHELGLDKFKSCSMYVQWTASLKMFVQFNRERESDKIQFHASMNRCFVKYIVDKCWFLKQNCQPPLAATTLRCPRHQMLGNSRQTLRKTIIFFEPDSVTVLYCEKVKVILTISSLL